MLSTDNNDGDDDDPTRRSCCFLSCADLETGETIIKHCFRDGTADIRVSSMALSPDSSEIAVAACGGGLQIFNAATLELARTIVDDDDFHGEIIAYSPSGEWIGASCLLNFIELYHVSTCDFGGSVRAHEGSIAAIAFSPSSGYLASGACDSKVVIWTVPELTASRTLDHPAWVRAIAFLSDDALVSSDLFANIFVWDVATGEKTNTIAREQGDGIAQEIQLSPDKSTFAVTISDGFLEIYDCETFIRTQLIDSIIPSLLCYADDYTVLLCDGTDNTVKAINLTTGEIITAFKEKDSRLVGMAVSGAGEWISY